jgi:hypothetical protein
MLNVSRCFAAASAAFVLLCEVLSGVLCSGGCSLPAKGSMQQSRLVLRCKFASLNPYQPVQRRRRRFLAKLATERL